MVRAHCRQKINDARHERTDLKVFIVVHTKRRMGMCGRAHPSFGMTLTFQDLTLLTS